MPDLLRSIVAFTVVSVFTWSAAPVSAQVPVIERVTFEVAVRRALERNPTVAEAATAILQAEGLLQQARAATGVILTGNVNDLLINASQGFEGTVIQPRNQVFLSANLSFPVLAPSQWAATTQARDQVEVAKLSTAEVRQRIGVAAAQAYLAVLAQSRQVEVVVRARDAALAHLDYARRRLVAGAGSRLNELRAAQEVSSDEARIENARLAVRRAQEALGVLLAADGPVDAVDEPVFDMSVVPARMRDPALSTAPGIVPVEETWLTTRPDIQLFAARGRAADRVVQDSSKDWYPSIVASFEPTVVAPPGAFAPGATWRFMVALSQPILDGGQRKSLQLLRQAAAESSKLSLSSVQNQARSEVRLADETVRSTERALSNVRLSAQQAGEVLTITTTAFEAGATTNLEVIDAQRSARDAESAVEIAEDAVRRARLDLLTALGRFP